MTSTQLPVQGRLDWHKVSSWQQIPCRLGGEKFEPEGWRPVSPGDSMMKQLMSPMEWWSDRRFATPCKAYGWLTINKSISYLKMSADMLPSVLEPRVSILAESHLIHLLNIED